jgi:hypothetical protein
LDVVEGDPATQGAVDALVELAYDSLDIIAWSLSELLERLAKVRHFHPTLTLILSSPTRRNSKSTPLAR